MNRRKFVRKAIRFGLSGVALGQAPLAFTKQSYRIRVLGTHVTLQEELRRRAEKDLGISVVFEPGGSAAVLHKASTNPGSFDLYEQWSNSINVLWSAGAIQPIERSRLQYWNDINSLTKEGRLSPQASVGDGDAPYKLLYVQDGGTLSERESKKISFLPYVHNVDSIGYNADLVKEGVPYNTESWGWLFEERFRGKVALVNAPTIGLFDVALAARSKGLVSFQDIGNMSRQEMDQLFKVLLNLKKEGHFRGFWSSVPKSVEFMKKGEVLVESMFSPAVATLRGDGIKCLYAAPKEGYRAWHGVMCLSSKTTDSVKDACYEYMNWWLSGWPGAFIARQGYYISTPHLSKKYLSEDEWNYWYQGKASLVDLKNTAGKTSIKAGETRRGGSYQQRFSQVAVWNTVMKNYEYSLFKWNELLSS